MSEYEEEFDEDEEGVFVTNNVDLSAIEHYGPPRNPEEDIFKQ